MFLCFAGAEQRSRLSQGALNPHCDRVRCAEHAPRGSFCFLERRHGLAEVVERGGGGGVVEASGFEKISWAPLAADGAPDTEESYEELVGVFTARLA